MSENQNSNDYGFSVTTQILADIKIYLDGLKEGNESKWWLKLDFHKYHWFNLQVNFRKNREKYDFPDEVNWIFDYDFYEFD